ncbi:putative major facilitator superfamily transporter [Phaeomoniella chlamydospora]|uniref:Putative major facilitator superfamily transporter n=1 Tax=Phaeomoniella chlamydospora TaxID=158046 RepID=A0A0G2ECF3_PHACM|nr:putative major facilitator superfamily transporter [Phaeomoniella chlamydospora]
MSRDKSPIDGGKDANFLQIEKGDQYNGNSFINNPVLTRKLLLKMDARVLPVLAVLFLCSFLDRTNVGNAKLYGLEKAIGITDLQYDSALSIFYAFYIISEVPSNLVLKRVSPKIWLPVLTFTWGVFAMCLGFITGFGSFMAVRALLGLAEGGLLPGIVLYLSSMYTRAELALRIGLFYTAASLSGAFGGLLARGLSEIGYRGGQSPWRWIFIIEGILTSVVGIASYFLLPNGLSSARFLTDEEREYGVQRLANDKSKGQTGSTGESVEKFQWSEVARGFFSVQTWLSASAYFAILSGLYSFGLFVSSSPPPPPPPPPLHPDPTHHEEFPNHPKLPTIIKGLGYTSNEAQLWSVIPYAAAAVVTVIVAFISDRLRLRGVMMLITLPIAIIGYAVIANVDSNKVRYGMTFLMATGLYGSVPPVLSWISNNSAGHYKRATATALQLAIANCGGFVAGTSSPFLSFLLPNSY